MKNSPGYTGSVNKTVSLDAHRFFRCVLITRQDILHGTELLPLVPHDILGDVAVVDAVGLRAEELGLGRDFILKIQGCRLTIATC